MKKTMNRYISMLLSVLMVLSSLTVGFVIFDTTADAAAAGSYKVRVTWNCSNDGTLKKGYPGYEQTKNDSCGYSILYAEDNGHASTFKTEDHDMKSEMGSKKTYTNEYTLSGFPVGIWFMINDDNAVTKTVANITKLEVSPATTTNWQTVWSGEMHVDSSSKRYYCGIYCTDYFTNIGTSYTDSKYTSGKEGNSPRFGVVKSTDQSNWKVPYVDSFSSIGDKTVTVPNSVNTDTSTVYDQYGVSWYQAPYWSLHTSTSESQTAGNQTGYSNITFTSGEADNGTLSSSYKLFNTYTSSNSLTVYANPYLSGKTGASSAITINNAQFTVTLNQNGGTGGTSSQSVYNYRKGGNITTLPTKEGYTFDGYYDAASNGTQYINSSGAWVKTWDKEAAGTLYAHWSPITYTVTLIDNGTTSTASYSSDSNYTFTSPTKTGYTFNNWKVVTAAGNWTDGETISSGTTTSGKYGNATLESQYTANNYTVKFDANGGSGTMNDETFTYGTGQNLSSNAFTRTGYTFAGWSTSKTATAAAYTDGQSVSNLAASGTVTLYAVWTANTYTVKFNANGGSGTMSNETFTYGTAKNLSPNLFEREGYAFAGWCTDSGGIGTIYSDAQKVSNLTSTNGATVTLYAQWSPDSYTLTLSDNGTTVKKTYTIEDTYTFTTPTKTGYTFNNWKVTTADGNWTDGDTYNGGDAISGMYGDTTLTSQYTANTYTVKFDGNTNTSGSMDDETFTYDQAKALTSNTFTKTGYTFLGWSTDKSAATAAYTDGQSVSNLASSGTITLYAVWSINSYNVTFKYKDASGSDVTSTTAYKYGSQATAPETPDYSDNKYDYTFSSWSPAVSTVTGDVTYTAQYSKTAITYTLTLVNGSSSSTVEYSASSEKTLGTPVKAGYTFTGWLVTTAGGSWSTGNTFSSSDTTSGKYGNATLTAQWTANTYTVKFNANGGTGKIADETFTYDTAKALTANTFTKTGYTFSGWATTADGAKAYSDGESVSNLAASGTVTLYAVWTANTYTVKFNANGGSGTMSDETFTYDAAKALTSNAFTRTGYTFSGWATSKTATAAAYTDGQSVSNLAASGTVTLYAVWTANTYTVKFNANGGTGYMANETFTYDVKKAITPNLFTRDGYAFAGWNTDPDGNGKYYSDISKVSNLTSKNKDTVTLYAQWSAEEYTLTVSDNGTTTEKMYTIENSYTFAAPTKTGYTFNCWEVTAADDDGSWKVGDTYKGGATVTGKYGDATVTAKYTPNNYTVKFDANGGTGTMSDETFTYDKSQALTSNTFTRTGYTFAGWSTDKSATSAKYQNNASVSNLTSQNGGTVTLYAVWSVNSYNVTFKYKDASGTDVAKTTAYNYGTEVTAPSVPGYSDNNYDYTFSSWSPAVSTVTGDVTYTAQYTKTPIKYTLTLVNGSSSKTVEYSVTSEKTLGAPTKTGYTFAGWLVTTAGGNWSTGNTFSSSDTTSGKYGNAALTAQWTANTYTVKFDANGGSGTMNDETFTYDKSQALTANEFTRTGYTFAGWAASSTGAKVYDNGQSVKNLASSGTATLYAVWTANTYTVKFNSNGGSGTMSDETFTYDQSKALTANAFTRTGYMFSGWNTSSDGNGTSYSDSASVKNLASADGSSATLYAQWKIINTKVYETTNTLTDSKVSSGDYNTVITLTDPTDAAEGKEFDKWEVTSGDGKVKFDTENKVWNFTFGTTDTHIKAVYSDIGYKVLISNASNGAQEDYYLESSDGTDKYILGTTVTLPEQSVTGYRHTGWTVSEDGGKGTLIVDKDENGNVTSASYKIGASDAKITAKFTPIKYSVVFNSNTGYGNMSVQSFTYDNNQNLTANTFTKTGYTFSGWNTTPDGKGTSYSDSASVKNLAVSDGAKITLYAQWTANTYTVAFDGNGATSGSTASQTLTYDAAETNLNANGFAKTGYTFAGWAKSKDGAKTYDNGQSVKNLASSGMVTLYAVWTANTYTVKFNSNGGTGTMSDETFTYDQSKALTSNKFTRKGYTFSGWAKSADGAKAYDNGQSVKNLASSGTATLYAVWTANTYSVAFNPNGGAGYMANETFTYDVSKNLSSNAYVKTGYTFLGWSTDKSASNT